MRLVNAMGVSICHKNCGFKVYVQRELVNVRCLRVEFEQLNTECGRLVVVVNNMMAVQQTDAAIQSHLVYVCF